MPRNAPETTTQVASTALLSVPIAITTSVAQKPTSAPTAEGSVPKRRCRRGATTTEVKASSTPQPKKIRPIWAGSCRAGRA